MPRKPKTDTIVAPYNASAAVRTDLAMELLAVGYSPRHVAAMVARRYRVSEATGRRDVSRAKQRFRDEEKKRRPERKARYRKVTELILQRAIATNQLVPAVAAVKLLCDLDGVTMGDNANAPVHGVLLIDGDGNTKSLDQWAEEVDDETPAAVIDV